jgi:hypothetical protein
LEASVPYEATESKLNDKSMNLCINKSEKAFSDFDDSDNLIKKFKEAIRKILVAYQVNLGTTM